MRLTGGPFTRGTIAHLLGGLGLATAFFLPIAASGRLDPSLLMWTTRHTGELAVDWALYAVLATASLAWLARSSHPRLEAVLLAGLCAPSAVSLVAVVGREGALPLGVGSLASAAVTLAIAAILVLIVERWLRTPKELVAFVRQILPFGALLLVPTVTTLVALNAHANTANTPAARVGTEPLTPARAPAPAAGPASARPSGCRNVFILVFDELSYSVVFSGNRSTMPSVSSRLASAQVYHRAFSQSSLTDTSIANYISAAAPRGWRPENGAAGPFGIAKSLGLDTEVVGWYFPYCEVLGSRVDRCRTYSMYNASTLHDGFSALATFGTVLNLWPYQYPSGLLKRPAATWLHRSELNTIVERASLQVSSPVLRWVHLNVPHPPWLTETGVLARHAFDQTRERYVRQADEVDRAFAQIMGALEAQPAGSNTTVIMTGDHGSRHGLAGDPLHVPLVVFTPGATHEDINTDVGVADVLKRVVQQACTSG